MLKTWKSQVFVIREPVPSPKGPIPPGVYEISGSSKRLQPYLEKFKGQLPVNVRQLDADAFEADFERHAESKSEPPAPPEKLTRVEIEKKYGWPAGTCERAELFGFPKSTGWKINPQGQQRSLYIAAHVEKWAAGIAELAEILQVR